MMRQLLRPARLAASPVKQGKTPALLRSLVPNLLVGRDQFRRTAETTLLPSSALVSSKRELNPIKQPTGSTLSRPIPAVWQPQNHSGFKASQDDAKILLHLLHNCKSLLAKKTHYSAALALFEGRNPSVSQAFCLGPFDSGMNRPANFRMFILARFAQVAGRYWRFMERLFSTKVGCRSGMSGGSNIFRRESNCERLELGENILAKLHLGARSL